MEVRTKEERLPESSEVVIDPRGHVHHGHVCKHMTGVTRGLKPSYAASARKVLMSSTRGLMRLQGSLSSNLSSLYVNDVFQDGQPCPAVGCPLNPKTRVSLLLLLEETGAELHTSSVLEYETIVHSSASSLPSSFAPR